MLTDREARQQIIQIVNELFSMGLLTATGGNISAKAEEDGTFWITPSQMYKGGLSEDDLVRIRPDGTVLEGSKVPSVEYHMHWRCYEVRQDCTAAVHTLESSVYTSVPHTVPGVPFGGQFTTKALPFCPRWLDARSAHAPPPPPPPTWICTPPMFTPLPLTCGTGIATSPGCAPPSSVKLPGKLP